MCFASQSARRRPPPRHQHERVPHDRGGERCFGGDIILPPVRSREQRSKMWRNPAYPRHFRVRGSREQLCPTHKQRCATLCPPDLPLRSDPSCTLCGRRLAILPPERNPSFPPTILERSAPANDCPLTAPRSSSHPSAPIVTPRVPVAPARLVGGSALCLPPNVS